MLKRELPFLRIFVPLCIGIISGLYVHPGMQARVGLIVISLTGLITSAFFNKWFTNIFFGAAFSFSLFTYGLLHLTLEKDKLTELKPEKTIYSSVITDFPEYRNNSVMINAKLNEIISGETISPVTGSMVLYCQEENGIDTLMPGDLCFFRCTPIRINNKGNPYEFDYKFYMESRGTRYYAFLLKNDLLFTRSPSRRNIKYEALIIRQKIISIYEKLGITGERLALLSAITLGEKSKLDPEQKQVFIKAGVMHIMAVSGLHAVILSLFIFNILFFMKRRYNLLRVMITVLLLWVFAFVTGLTPSVLRATLMFSFLQAGVVMKRRVNAINSVLASAFILILINPYVIFDAGFLLSYSAVFFIIGFYNDLYHLLNFRYRLADLIWQSVSVTMVAQAGTLSLTIMLFNRFPVWFVLSNVIIVPLSSLLIITGCTAPVTYLFLPVARVLGVVIDWLTWLTEYLTRKAASLPFSTIDNIGLTIPEYILLTIAVSFMLYFLLKKPRISPLYPIAAFCLFFLSSTVKNIVTCKKNELIVYSTPGKTTIGIKTGRILNVYTDESEIPKEVMRHISVLGMRICKNSIPDGTLMLEADNKRIIITDSLNFIFKDTLSVDFLILTGRKPYINESCFVSLRKFNEIITTDALTGFKTYISVLKDRHRSIWSVRESGAYIKAL